MKVSALASHSALDIFDGAKDEGYGTIALCKKGRERPYLEFQRVVDNCIILDSFKEIASESLQRRLKKEDVLIVPNRSLAVYVGYDELEGMTVPFFGNKFMLRWEERTGAKEYYRILDKARIRRPRTFSDISDVDRPVIAKLPEAERRAERGFFIANGQGDFRKKLKALTAKGVVDSKSVKSMIIEELVVGAHFNVNYFNSRLLKRVEIISVDRRIQSDLDGLLKLPADLQIELGIQPRFIEVGHEPVTVRESLLERLFDAGTSFVEATEELEPPGIIGPFTLQLMVTPDLNVVVFDVSPRIGGGTNVYMGTGSQYSKLYFGRPISMGRRIAMEIKQAAAQDELKRVVS